MLFNFRILCFSHDEHLQRTRQWLLETRYEAVCVTSLAELQQQAESAGGFDAVMLCHSLSAMDCRAAAEIARRRWPAAKVVALATQWGECAAGGPWGAPDKVVPAQAGPAALMSSLAEMLPAAPMLGAVA